jgi:pyrimidine-specific ribonucleoside hydrolase
MRRVDVILDVDTGVDDALALLFACRSPELAVRAISCVAGNAEVDQVVANTLKVLDAVNAPDVPVARGMARPLIEPPRPARHVHGEDGMADLGLPASQRRPVAEHAVEMLQRTLRTATSPITLVPLAPMTNIAVLLRTYPEVVPHIERIVLMGGSVAVGNATAAAEFNIWHDPEAAAIVLGSGVPVTMYGLDVFYDVAVDATSVAELTASDDPAQQLAGRLLADQMARFGMQAAAIGDAGAVAAVIRPAGLTTARLPVQVELAGTWTRGRTIVDQRQRSVDLDQDPHGAGALVDVALQVDAAAYRDLFLATLRG